MSEDNSFPLRPEAKATAYNVVRKQPCALSLALTLCFLQTFLSAALASDTAPAGGLLIVAPQKFHAAMGDYVRHKDKQLPAELADLDTILAEQSGVDAPEKLKRYLYARWTGDKIAYVLLVGDADTLPVRYMCLDRITPAACDYAFYPSDLYYADLADGKGAFDNWNAAAEGFHAAYFGEVRGEKNKSDPINYDRIDYLPDVAVGRWPVSTANEVAILAAKTVRYEQGILDGTKPNLRRAAFLSVGGWVDTRSLMDRLAAALPAGWMVEKRYYSDAKQKSDTPPPTAQEVVALMNAGLGLLCHAGHGQDRQWQDSFGLAHLKQLDNADRLPIVFSAGCSTARFAALPPYEPYVDVNGAEHKGSDHGEVFTEPPPPPAPYQSGKYNPPGLGEQLLRGGPNGAVAYIGCNTGSQPCALTLLEGFVSAIKNAPHPRIGDCYKTAITYYHKKEKLPQLTPTQSWYPPSIFFQAMKFMLFADPSLILPPPA